MRLKDVLFLCLGVFIGYKFGYKKSDNDFIKQWNSLNWKSFYERSQNECGNGSFDQAAEGNE